MAGTYQVIATVNGCPSPAAFTEVIVNTPPAAPAAESNSPVCEGQIISLTTPTVTGATYSWTGPNGFTSSAQNPSISNVVLAFAGNYQVTISLNGCVSEAGDVDVAVSPRPATPIASNDGPA
jgi:hypothetical protein